MKHYRIRKGYDIPIVGRAEEKWLEVARSESIGVDPREFRGIKPRLSVKESDTVRIGSPLFYDKNRPEIRICSPAAGKIQEIVYGPRRVIEAIRIAPAEENFEQFESFRPDDIAAIPRESLIELMLVAGLWPLLRQRPFDVLADPGDRPSSIFVNAMHTAPLAADPNFCLQSRLEEYRAGMEALKIFGAPVHLVVDAHEKDSGLRQVSGVSIHEFSGPHPAGLTGTHISRIDPILNPEKRIWYCNAHDVVQIGAFLLVGQYPIERNIALAGPGLDHRGYAKTVAGASLASLTHDHLYKSEQRLISGNILSGRIKSSSDYLGFYDDLITVIPEGREQRFLGWMAPGWDRWTFGGTYMAALLSALSPSKKYAMDSNRNGEDRALVKTGDYQKVTALDVLPDYLLKSILAGDIEEMEQLGILECSPEDFALCSYICPSKVEFTEIIRRGLDMMHAEIG